MRNFIWLFKALTIIGLAGAIFGAAGWFSYDLFIKPNLPPPREKQAEETAQAFIDPGLPEFEAAMALVQQRKLVEARSALNLFLDHHPFSEKVADARAALGKINTDIFFSTTPAPEKIVYEIQPGDAIIKIERKLRTPREIIMRSNNLDDPTRLRIGQVLLVTPVDFSIVINQKNRTVLVQNRKTFFKEYKAVSWHPVLTVNVSPKSPLNGAVTAKLAWRNGARVAPNSPDFAESERWVELSVKGFTLYSEGGQKPNNGVSLSPEDMQELSTLVGKNVPVSIQ